MANGITDTPVLMAAKAHLRNNKPLVIFISTNDGLGMNMKNIGLLLNTKNIYFVPFGQDDAQKNLTPLWHIVRKSARRWRWLWKGNSCSRCWEVERKKGAVATVVGKLRERRRVAAAAAGR